MAVTRGLESLGQVDDQTWMEVGEFLGKVNSMGLGGAGIAGARTTDLSQLASTISGVTFGTRNIPKGQQVSRGSLNQGSIDIAGGPVGNNQATSLGPGVPPAPFPLGGDPRQFFYRPGYNMPVPPGEGRPISMDTLRAVADTEWLTRKALEIKKNQLLNLEWDLVAKDRKSYTRNKAVMQRNADKIKQIKGFWSKPDGRLPFKSWLRVILEDHYVLDGIALYKRRNMDPDDGPDNADGSGKMGRLIALQPIDGATIKPLLDDSGYVPLPPLPGYQQFITGIPRFDFTTQELLYAVQNRRTVTPYGFSPVEQFLFLVNLQLRYWAWIAARYTDGTLPEGVAEAPPNWSLPQIEEMNEYWDRLMAGDPRALRKLQFVPAGFQWHSFKEQGFDQPFARLLIELALVTMDITPQEFGLEPAHGGLGGSGHAEKMEDVNFRRGVMPAVNFIKTEILDPITQEEFGADELEWVIADEEDEFDKDKVTAIDISIKNGRMPLDQIVEQDGGEAPGIGRVFALGNMLLGQVDLKLINDQGWAAFMKQVGEAAPQPAAGGMNRTDAAGVEPEALKNKIRQAAITQSPGGEKPVEGAMETKPDESVKSAGLDWTRWRTKALKAMRDGRSPNVKFESAEISTEEKAAIRTLLNKAASVDDVRAVFDQQAKPLAANLKLADLLESERTLRQSHRDGAAVEKMLAKQAEGYESLAAAIAHQAAPVVNVQPANVHVDAPVINMPEQKPPVVKMGDIIPVFQMPEMKAPDVKVDVQAPSVHVDSPVTVNVPEQKSRKFKYDDKGRLVGTE